MMLSFVIPCYGSEDTLRGVYNEICSKMQERPALEYEIIAVNDCSPDKVWEVIRTIASEDERFKGICLAKNGGKHAAMMAGFSVCRGDVIINLDDDGQCPLDRLWDLTEPLDNGYDVSIASYHKKKESAFKRFGSGVNQIMAVAMINKPRDLQLSNFSAVRRFVIDEILKYTNPYPYIDGLILRTTSRIINVPMEQRERSAGVGHYTLKKSLALWLNGFTAFSVKPLRLATVMGVISAFIGVVFTIYTIIHKIVDPDVLIGYSSLMSVLLIVGGVLMFMLGLVGEYIGRIYISINNSPQYVIRERLNDESDERSMIR